MILSLMSQDSGRKLIVRACCLAPLDNAKISAGDLELDQDKGSDTHKKTVTGDTVVAHQIPREVYFERDLRELLVLFQCLAFLGLILVESSRTRLSL